MTLNHYALAARYNVHGTAWPCGMLEDKMFHGFLLMAPKCVELLTAMLSYQMIWWLRP